jgi:hypothetical protein
MMRLKEFLILLLLLIWSEIDTGTGTTTPPPSIQNLAPPPEEASPAITTNDATYSAHFRKKGGKTKQKTLLHSYGVTKYVVFVSDDVYLLGGYAHLELPIPLSTYLDAMNTTSIADRDLGRFGWGLCSR